MAEESEGTLTMSSFKDSRHSATTPPTTGERRSGPALEAMHQFIRWLVPTVDRFPRQPKFLPGDRIQTTALTVLERLTEAMFTRSRLLDHTSTNLDKSQLPMLLSKTLGFNTHPGTASTAMPALPTTTTFTHTS